MKHYASDRYDHMLYRKCGKWGLKLPAVSLGAWQTFGGYRTAEIAKECIFRAFDLGITHFDLANNYGFPPGNAEIVVGKILKELPREEIIISTKSGFLMWPGPYGEWGSRKSMLTSLDQSLKRLNVDYVDIFYHHRPDPETPLEETLSALETAVQQGKALYAAVSNYSGQQFTEAYRVINRREWAPLVLHQASYSMFRRHIETDLFPHTRTHGTGVIVFCPLAQGLLTDRYLHGIPEDSRAATWSKEDQQRRILSKTDKIRALHAIAQERGQTLAQMAIAWVLRCPEVTSALIGASRVTQIEENVKALENLNFTDEEYEKIDAVLHEEEIAT